jgi:hypothetical protein
LTRRLRACGTTTASRGKCCIHGELACGIYQIAGGRWLTLWLFCSSVIATNLLNTDEILRAGRSS